MGNKAPVIAAAAEVAVVDVAKGEAASATALAAVENKMDNMNTELLQNENKMDNMNTELLQKIDKLTELLAEKKHGQ